MNRNQRIVGADTTANSSRFKKRSYKMQNGYLIRVPVIFAVDCRRWISGEFFLDPGRLAGKLTQVVELGAAYSTLALDLD